jgi:CRP-like cAMP-binding protein
VRREHYEPGQDIVRQGEVGRRLFVLWKSEADVFRETASGPELLATLGPGQHFGEAAVFEQVRRTATVRARTQVEVLAVGQMEAIALTAIRSFGETVRRTPGTASKASPEDQVEVGPENMNMNMKSIEF